MNDHEFLNWIADRFVNVHNESPNVDFVVRLRCLADQVVELDKMTKELNRVILEELHP